MSEKKKTSIFADKRIMTRALKDSLIKLDPREQIKNPVMFMVYVSAILTLVMFVFSLAGIRDAKPWFILAVSVILWFTDLFGNFAEAIAEGRGKAQADALKGKSMTVRAVTISKRRKYALSAELPGRTVRLFRARKRSCAFPARTLAMRQHLSCIC